MNGLFPLPASPALLCCCTKDQTDVLSPFPTYPDPPEDTSFHPFKKTSQKVFILGSVYAIIILILCANQRIRGGVSYGKSGHQRFWANRQKRL